MIKMRDISVDDQDLEDSTRFGPAVTAGPWAMPWSRTACGLAREMVSDAFAGWGLPRDTQCVAGLLVSELVGNALRHGRPPVRLTLRRASGLRCLVSDGSPKPPQLIVAGPDDECGRGLELVATLSARWGWDQERVGKSVWFDLRTGDDVGNEVSRGV